MASNRELLEELRAEVAALRAEVALLRAQTPVVLPIPTPMPYWPLPSPYTGPYWTCGTTNIAPVELVSAATGVVTN